MEKANILDSITNLRKSDVEISMAQVKINDLQNTLESLTEELGKPISLLEQIHSSTTLIAAAEFKRSSPSKGDIAVDLAIEGMDKDVNIVNS